MVEESRAVVVGVDFGTLSGRAVVVRSVDRIAATRPVPGERKGLLT
jgi:ribulose kinase